MNLKRHILPPALVCLYLILNTYISYIYAQVSFTVDRTTACSPALINFEAQGSGVVSYQWNFGNGSTSNLANPGTTYTEAGEYHVELTVTFANGQTGTRDTIIRIFGSPQSGFSPGQTLICAGEHINFEDASINGSGNITRWIWDYGDGSIDTSAIAGGNHIYEAGGLFGVKLIVVDENGCDDVIEIPRLIEVQPTPDTDFAVDQNYSCTIPHTVQFTSNNQNDTHQWMLSNGDTSNEVNPSFTFNQTGNISVTHIVTNSLGCSDTLIRSDFISINQTIIPIQLSDTVVCPGVPIEGSCGSGNFTQIIWNFGNGFTDNECEVLFSYPEPGLYSVSLQLSDNTGCTFNAIKTVRVSEPPEVNFTATDSLLCSPPFTTLFEAQTTGAVDWLWKFGEFGSGNGLTPSFTFPNLTDSFAYDVELIATNADGCSRRLKKENFITTHKPRALIGFSDYQGCAPLTVDFSDNTRTPFEITSWQWDLGNGETSTEPNPTTTYTDTGRYDISLIITTNAGCNDTLILEKFIKVGNPPIPDFEVDTNHVCAQIPLQFTNLSQYADSAFWEFGDGDTAQVLHPEHVYIDTGWMSINMTVFHNGCASSISRPNYIYIDPPVALFQPNPVFSCSTGEVQFTDMSLGADQWLWSFGDGDTSHQQHPLHLYEEPGRYSVGLTVKNDRTGCEFQSGGFVLIDPAEMNMSVDKFSGCAPLSVQFSDQSPEAVKWFWDFGDSQSSTIPNVSHIFTDPGTYTVRHSIFTILAILGTDTLFCSISDSIKIRVFEPVANFATSDSAGCVPFNFQLQDLSITQAPITQWGWNITQNGVRVAGSNEEHPFFILEEVGIYTVNLAILDSAGCSSAVTKQDFILTSLAIPEFDAEFPINCPNNPIQFNNLSQGNNLVYLWDFGDGNISTEENPAHTYAQEGFFTVSLTVSDGICDTTIIKENYVQIETPLIDILADNTTADCPPLAVNFSPAILSIHDFNQWQWDLGNGNTSGQMNPSSIYAFAGSYDVSLIATAASGCADTLFLPDLIQLDGPEGTFDFTPKNACPGDIIEFTANTTNTAFYKWDFGNGTILEGSTLNAVTHRYDSAKVYFPALVISDDDGCEIVISSPDSLIIYPAPRADFEADTLRICEMGQVQFTDLSESLNPIDTWAWDLGNGTISALQHPAYNYPLAGTYHVSLTVTTINNCTGIIEKPAYIEVIENIPPIKPDIQFVSVLSDESIELQFEAYDNSNQDFAKYIIYRAATNGLFRPIHESNDISETYFVDRGLFTNLASYCYQVQAVNYCGSATNLTHLDAHCSILLKAQGEIDAIQLNWNAYQGWPVETYRIYRVDGYGTHNGQLIVTVDGNTFSYLDTEVFCEDSYNYRIEAVAANGLTYHSWSNISSASATHIGPPFPLNMINVSVVDNISIQLAWEELPLDQLFEYYLLEKSGAGRYEVLTTFPAEMPITSYLDEAVSVQDQSYYYRVFGIDSCGDQTLIGRIGKSILLSGKKQRNGALLNWTPYEEWESGVEYYDLEVLDETTNQFIHVGQTAGGITTFVDSITYLPQYQYCYRVIAHELNGNSSESISNYACVEMPPLLYTPNAFTPNGDGFNDEFFIKGDFIDSFHLMIFSRWGSKIFESRDMQAGWDGTYQGNQVPEGVYVFRVIASGFDGRDISRAGTVTVIR